MKASNRLKAFVVDILIAGIFIGSLIGEELYAYTLEDFGYNVLRPPTHLPVVIIIVNFAGQPAFVHDNYYYEDLLRNRIALFYRAMSDGKVTIQHAGTININLTQTDLQLGEERKNGRIIEEAGRSNFDFASYDANHNGTVTHNELGFLIIDNVTEIGAANRTTDPSCIRTRQNIQICAKLALAGHRASISSMAHELSHSLNTIDLYGDYDLSGHLSLMGVTIFPNIDDMQLFHFDPWHKMALGWHRPTILSLREPHMNIPLHAKASDSPYNSYILYDPSHGNREFFMVEFRTPNTTSASGVNRTIYDTDVAGTGVVLWHVNLGSDLKPRNLQEPPQHIPGIFALGANLDKFDSQRVWGSGAETPPLRWTDGTSAGGAKIWVHNFASNATDITISVGQQLTAPTPPLAITLERDTDRPGADLLSRETATVDQCTELCRGDSQCRAFTHYHGRCYIKNGVPTARPLQGAISGVIPITVQAILPPIAPAAPPAITVERDTDRPGADFFDTAQPSVDACAALCQREPRCRVFTYWQGNCWLKDGVPAPVPLQGASSGVVRR
jgi:M6 family metalloprotease-like protein